MWIMWISPNAPRNEKARGRKNGGFSCIFVQNMRKWRGGERKKARRAGQGRVRAAARRGLSPKIPGLSPVIHSMDPAKTQAFQGFRLVIHFSPGPTTTTKYLYYYYNNHTGGGRRPPGARGQ